MSIRPFRLNLRHSLAIIILAVISAVSSLSSAIPSTAVITEISSTVTKLEWSNLAPDSNSNIQIVFDVDNDTESFLIQAIGEQKQTAISFESLLDPNQHFVMGKVSRNYIPAVPGLHFPENSLWENPSEEIMGVRNVITSLIPNNPDSKVISGQWQLNLRCDDTEAHCKNNKITIQILRKKKPTNQRTSAVIPVRLFFANNSRWHLRDIKQNSEYQKYISLLKTIFEYNGFLLNIEQENDLNTHVATEEPSTSSQTNEFEQISQVFKSIENNNAINIVLFQQAKSIRQNSYNSERIIANSFGLPGLAFNNNFSLGIAINTDDNNFSSSELAARTAHEIGHYLGLFHVCDKIVVKTEIKISDQLSIPDLSVIESGLEDPLPDTSCEYQSLMYDGFTLQTLLNQKPSRPWLSLWQKRIMRMHPLVQD